MISLSYSRLDGQIHIFCISFFLSKVLCEIRSPLLRGTKQVNRQGFWFVSRVLYHHKLFLKKLTYLPTDQLHTVQFRGPSVTYYTSLGHVHTVLFSPIFIPLSPPFRLCFSLFSHNFSRWRVEKLVLGRTEDITNFGTKVCVDFVDSCITFFPLQNTRVDV